MLYRWLLPFVALFALLGNAAAAFGAAGTFAMSTCCCPDPTTCQCHDHGPQSPDPQLKRCAGDAVKVMPHLAAFEMPQVVTSAVVMSEHTLVSEVVTISDRFVDPPEPPPF